MPEGRGDERLQASPGPEGGACAPDAEGAGVVEESGKKRSWQKPVLIASVIVVVAALVAVGVHLYLSNKAYEEAHREVTVPIVLKAEGYGQQGGSGIPLAVEGEDLDGAAVAQQVLVGPDGGGVDLKRGAYTIRPDGPPIGDSGTLFLGTPQSVQVTIDEDGLKLPDGMEDITFTYEPVPPEGLTDEQVEAARAWMAKYGIGEETAKALADKALALRQAELDRIAEEKRKAEEEAQRKAEEERLRAEEERLARFDRLWGSFCSNGAAAPRGKVTSVVFGDDEVTVTGELFELDGGSAGASIGSKSWVFGIDDDTQVGFAVYDGFHEQSIGDVADTWASGNFPSINMYIEDGIVRRMYSSA